MKIRFDNKDFINYEGMRRLDLPEGWEAIYNKLVQDNALTNSSNGYSFHDSTLHVTYNWNFLRKHHFLRPSFTYNLFDRLISGPNRVNKSLRFTGLFRIVNYDRQVHLTQTGYYLIPTRDSYISEVIAHRDKASSTKRLRIDPYYRFSLQRDQIWEDSRNRAAIPYDSNSNFSTEDEFIKGKLFFDLAKVIKTSREYFEHDFKYRNHAPDLLYENGIKTEIIKTLEPDKRKTQTRDQVMQSKDRIIAACFWLLKNERRPKFKYNSDICKHLETHLKGIPALNYAYVKEFIKTATDELKEREQAQDYEETYLERIKKKI